MTEKKIGNTSPHTHAVDTHAHLDDERFSGDLEQVIGLARQAGIQYIITVGVDAETSRNALDIARSNDGIYSTAGFHPHEASNLSTAGLHELRELASQPETVAIGEIGLDYFHNHSPRNVQRSAFRSQLELAADLGLPVVIHNRDASQDCLSLLKEFSGCLSGVAHCFSGGKNDAETFVEMGFFISFAGNITYPKADNLRKLAATVPSDRLLAETDCPWLAPQSVRGKRNEPSFILDTFDTLAEIRNSSRADIIKITTSNAFNLFKISPS